MQTRYQLATMKKGSLSVADFFQKAQNLSHILAAVEAPLKDSELISYILAGLSAEYDSLVTSITTRIDPITLEDLYGHLLTHEQRLEQHNFVVDLSLSSVNVAQRTVSGKPHKLYSRQGSSSGGRGRGRGRGRGPPYFFAHSGSITRPMCQVCLRPGDTAAKCYHKLDHAYQCVSPHPLLFSPRTPHNLT
jgi:hypothetical protein